MNQLLSMLVPLETLPGWPDARDPSVLEVLGLLVGAPLLVTALIAVITRVHHAVKGNAGTPAVANQPIWVNGQRVEPSIQGQASRDSIEAGHQAVTERTERDDPAESDHSDHQDDQTVRPRRARDDEATTGGAGARW